MASLDILCSNTLNLKNKITKIEHKKIFCGQSKILKNISWSINIYLKYFMTPTKPSALPSYILNGQSLSLIRKTERDYFANLDTKIMKDNRKLWKTVNPLFSEKPYSKESISLINKDGLITNNKDLAKTFTNSFSNIVNKLGIEQVPNDESNLSNIDESILKAIAKYENHASILRIKN